MISSPAISIDSSPASSSYASSYSIPRVPAVLAASRRFRSSRALDEVLDSLSVVDSRLLSPMSRLIAVPVASSSSPSLSSSSPSLPDTSLLPLIMLDSRSSGLLKFMGGTAELRRRFFW